MSFIDCDPELYGTYERVSAIADWVEARVLSKGEMRESALSDIAHDLEWNLESPYAQSDEAEIKADRLDFGRRVSRTVFSLLEERSAILGELYPFRIDDGKIGTIPLKRFRSSGYATLLATTLLHANKVTCSVDPKRVVEEMFARALRTQFVTAHNFAGASRGTGFAVALSGLGSVLRVSADANRAVTSSYAKDEDVDIVCRAIFEGDSRAGDWLFLGQITCARSDYWHEKMMEPSPSQWSKYLNADVEPVAFLGVPHHVSAIHMKRLAEKGQRLVVDRLRIAPLLRKQTAAESALVKALLDADVDGP